VSSSCLSELSKSDVDAVDGLEVTRFRSYSQMTRTIRASEIRHGLSNSLVWKEFDKFAKKLYKNTSPMK
jgi:hypothetical protein